MSLLLRLFLSFPILLLFMYLLKSSALQPYVELICTLLASITYSFVHFFNSNIVIDEVTIYLGTIEYGIMVVPECSALDIYFTLASLVLLEKVSVSTKVKTLIIGFIVIQAVNVLRLCLLFYARVYSLPPTYKVIHETYFPAFLAIISILLYCCWLSYINTVSPLANKPSKNKTINKSMTNAAACAFVSALLFTAWHNLIEPYTKYILYLPTKAVMQTSTTNWQNEVEVHGSENKLVINNHTFSSSVPVAEIDQQKEMKLSHLNHTAVGTKGVGLLMLPLLLSILLINRRSFRGFIGVLLIPVILVSVHMSLYYHSVTIKILQSFKFPAVLTYQGKVVIAESYSLAASLLLKHLDTTLIYFSIILVPIYYWRKTVNQPNIEATK